MDSERVRRQRILVVEPNADLRETLSLLLSEFGYAVEQAASLDGALALVDRESFDLIVSDLLVYGSAAVSDRFAQVERLRECAYPTPVGVLSAWNSPEEVMTGRKFAWALPKPFDMDQLLAEIAAARHVTLDQAEQRRAAVVRAYFVALAARDWDGLMELCSEDVVYVLPPPAPFAAEVHGREAFRRYTEDTYRQFPEVWFENVDAFALPDGMAARYLGCWRTPDGATQQQAGAVIFQFAGERIRQIGIRLNPAQLRALMGRA
jgi:CheY-like chemotaxis protein